MKISILLPAALALVLGAGLAPASGDAASYGTGCYVHHYAHRYVHRSHSYSNEDYRQWRQFGGTRGEW